VSGAWTIYRRELAGLFFSPLAWVLLCIALAFNGFFFVLSVKGYGGDVLQSMSFLLGGSYTFWMLVVLLPPLLTMRMFSEEARTGVLEFLLTAPVTDFAVVLGKLLAATTLMAVLWSSAFVYGLALAALGTPPDWAPLVSGVCGATLVSALFCAVGLAVSALSNTPLLAAFFSLPFLDALLALPPGSPLRVALGHANVITQFQASFVVGALDTKHVLFFVVWTAFFSFVATRVLEARRWW
jgi:ABC-2 type transport system permease protein